MCDTICMMKKNDIWIVLPAYNESAYIVSVLKELNKTGYPYVVVDDGSSDDTYKIAKRYTKHVVRHKINLGKGAALRTGCEYAITKQQAEALVFMDSDAQHSTAELALFQKALNDGHAMVLGIRSFDSAMPLIRIIGNRLGSVLILLLFGKYIPDIPSGYKAMTTAMYKKLKLEATGYNIEMEIAVKLAKKRFKFSTVPIATIYHDLERGFQPLDGIQMMVDLLKWRFEL